MGTVRSVGEAKVPGGKFVRVTLADGHARIDGDFFMGDADPQVLGDAARVLEDLAMRHAAPGPGGAYGSREAQVTPAAAAVARLAGEAEARLRPVLADALVGADAASVALAWVRALGCADPQVAAGLPGFEARRRSRIGCLERASRQAPGAGEGLPAEEVARRWRILRPVVVEDKPRGPAEQMDLDVQWAQEVARGQRPPTLRLWQWAAPAVVCGRYQSIPDEVDLQRARDLGYRVVRRASGGGAMVVTPGGTITYSLLAPPSFTQGLTARQSFRLCDAWLLDALRGLGVDARFAGLNDIASARGKIGGAAQLRLPGCLLHHATLAYSMDPTVLGSLLRTGREKMSDKAVRSAVRRVDPIDRQVGMPFDRLMARLADAARAFPAH